MRNLMSVAFNLKSRIAAGLKPNRQLSTIRMYNNVKHLCSSVNRHRQYLILLITFSCVPRLQFKSGTLESTFTVGQFHNNQRKWRRRTGCGHDGPILLVLFFRSFRFFFFVGVLSRYFIKFYMKNIDCFCYIVIVHPVELIIKVAFVVCQ